jgi:hypothetical protein
MANYAPLQYCILSKVQFSSQKPFNRKFNRKHNYGLDQRLLSVARTSDDCFIWKCRFPWVRPARSATFVQYVMMITHDNKKFHSFFALEFTFWLSFLFKTRFLLMVKSVVSWTCNAIINGLTQQPREEQQHDQNIFLYTLSVGSNPQT